jgi:hypothetical protein
VAPAAVVLMDAPAAAAAPGELCCDFGADHQRPYRDLPPHTYTDWLGFTYRLCDRHHRAFVTALERISRAGREGGRYPLKRGAVLRRILAEEAPAE